MQPVRDYGRVDRSVLLGIIQRGWKRGEIRRLEEKESVRRHSTRSLRTELWNTEACNTVETRQYLEFLDTRQCFDMPYMQGCISYYRPEKMVRCNTFKSITVSTSNRLLIFGKE